MAENVALTDEFDHPQGRFLNYDTYDTVDRLQLTAQAHVDIRSFADDEEWTEGVIGPQFDRNFWWGLSLTCIGNQTTVTSSVIHKGSLVYPTDALTGMADDDFLSVSFADFPADDIDLAQSYIEFTSDEDGGFINTVASIPFIVSLSAMTNGDTEFRVPLSAMAGIDRQFIRGVRFRITATTTNVVRILAVRALSKNWKYAPLDTDTRLHRLKSTVAPDASVTRTYDWQIPAIYRSGLPAGADDPQPINMSVAVEFNSGSRAEPNTISLFFRETAVNYTEMRDLEGTPLRELEGKPLPETTTTSYRARTMKELNLLKQSDLDGDTQLEIERVPDVSFSGYLTAQITWHGNGLLLYLQDSSGSGYRVGDDLIDGLAANTDYIFIVDLDDNSMRARVYELDALGNIETDRLVYDTGSIFDDFTFPRRKGRFGWSTTLQDTDAYISSIRTRRQIFAALETQPFESITPVEGCELTVSASTPYDYFREISATDDPLPTVTITRDPDRSTTGVGYRVFNPGVYADQGVQTNLADFYDFEQMEITFDVHYPRQALDAGINLRAFLSNDKGRVIELSMGNIQPDRWHRVRIDPGHPTAQTGRYRLFVVQDLPVEASTWWIDNIHITERSVSFYGRSVLEDPWGDAKVDWIPFKNFYNSDSTGIQFIQRGRHLQIKAVAHRQDSHIERLHAVPRYAQLGRFIWDSDELWTPQRPSATFDVVQNGLDVTFDATDSADPDGEVINYTWAFGDGATSVGPRVVHHYARAGFYSPSVIVTDSQGLQAQATQTIFVTVSP